MFGRTKSKFPFTTKKGRKLKLKENPARCLVQIGSHEESFPNTSVPTKRAYFPCTVMATQNGAAGVVFVDR